MTRGAFLVAVSAVLTALVLTQIPAGAQRDAVKRSRAAFADPPVVVPGEGAQPPADAVVLLGNGDVSGWRRGNGSPTGCRPDGPGMICESGAGDAWSVERFTDAQIHLEFNVPLMADQRDQLRGNSGVYIQGCYELQILDSWQNPTYPDGSCGALYGIAPPMVNASRRPGEWQSYDILFRAPRCGPAGEYSEAGRVTVYHNGVLIHDNVPITGRGAGCGNANVCEPGPLMLQDHSGFPGAPNTPMRFRNIWLRRLTPR